MTRPARLALLGPALIGLGALFAWAIAGLPGFGDYRGPYGYVLNGIVVPMRHATNVVMATTFDVRGVDTMGEEFILYASVLGVTLLLRDESGARRRVGATERDVISRGLCSIGESFAAWYSTRCCLLLVRRSC